MPVSSTPSGGGGNAEAEGRVLYVTLSAYLAQSARTLHAAHGFENPKQEVDFLSYRELLETLRVPPGREATLPMFAAWCERHRQTLRPLGELDAQALFEEFRGVIGAQPAGPLSVADYLALGTRRSLLNAAQRELALGLFQRYRAWLTEAGLHDSNLVAHEWRVQIAEKQPPVYDFVVIDEVQDLTPVQLALVLALLKAPGQFILCGDSHQIVHPNFLSWAALKSLFWQGLAGDAAQRQPLQLLQANFRNTRAVTALANRLLKIKQLARLICREHPQGPGVARPSPPARAQKTWGSPAFSWECSFSIPTWCRNCARFGLARPTRT